MVTREHGLSKGACLRGYTLVYGTGPLLTLALAGGLAAIVQSLKIGHKCAPILPV